MLKSEVRPCEPRCAKAAHAEGQFQILLPSREGAPVAAYFFLVAARRAASCRPWSFLADFEGDRSTRFDFLVPAIRNVGARHGCRDGLDEDSGAHFTRNFSAHGSIFSPFSSQCLRRTRRCLVAWRSFSGHLREERFHVLDSLESSFDAGTKFLLDENGRKLAQLEIGREMIAAIPGE